jgi:hypothetical protein
MDTVTAGQQMGRSAHIALFPSLSICGSRRWLHGPVESKSCTCAAIIQAYNNANFAKGTA